MINARRAWGFSSDSRSSLRFDLMYVAIVAVAALATQRSAAPSGTAARPRVAGGDERLSVLWPDAVSVLRRLALLALGALVWELVARSGMFSPIIVRRSRRIDVSSGGWRSTESLVEAWYSYSGRSAASRSPRWRASPLAC